ncbi:MAG: GNAT family N-acetyltransferase [Nanoarchaeota archaeon]
MNRDKVYGYIEFGKVHLREFKLKNIRGVLNLWKKTGIFFDKWDKKENLVKKCEMEKDLFIVAEDSEDHIIGTVMGVYNGWLAKVDHLAIHPLYQQLGLGTILMSRIEKKLKEKGAETILLDVKYNNRKVLRFYKKLGYVINAKTYSLRKDI